MKLNATPRLNAVMKAKGWTQVRLSEASGVPQGSISRFDKNSRHED
ncbi:helix-turn-helix transcriptional regulator, partial [Bacillus siamensis]|nr:helix-turn-helix transcriptional regulator [Bacillus siamensis]